MKDSGSMVRAQNAALRMAYRIFAGPLPTLEPPEGRSRPENTDVTDLANLARGRLWERIAHLNFGMQSPHDPDILEYKFMKEEEAEGVGAEPKQLYVTLKHAFGNNFHVALFGAEWSFRKAQFFVEFLRLQKTMEMQFDLRGFTRTGERTNWFVDKVTFVPQTSKEEEEHFPLHRTEFKIV